MNRATCIAIALASAASLSAAGQKGIAPRPSPNHYAAHAQRDAIGIGAHLLTAQQARDKFVSNLNRCCLIVELAFYPEKEKPANISLTDLSLLVDGVERPLNPSTPKVVAAALQQDAESQRDISVYPVIGVGYASGPGPNKGVYTTVGVDFAVRTGGSSGSSPRDRDTMETELSEKGLPEGAASAPVAGYVYFPYTPSRKKNAKAKVQLQYVLNGNKVLITLPTP
ncbi:MAG TPA: hypothetical protein VOA41_02040 [Candidatus Dormibacteraeota bacterium]|nr:hypothetical protein [Candidatus Dormibacteraeota bacterium]